MALVAVAPRAELVVAPGQWRWLLWSVSMTGFGLLGGLAMFMVMRKQNRMTAAALKSS